MSFKVSSQTMISKQENNFEKKSRTRIFKKKKATKILEDQIKTLLNVLNTIYIYYMKQKQNMENLIKISRKFKVCIIYYIYIYIYIYIFTPSTQAKKGQNG